MDIAIKIDAILEDLKSKVNLHVPAGYTDLSQEQLEIKSILDERRIHYLVHFTDKKNVKSIKEKGILSLEELKKGKTAFVMNDEIRKDNEPDYISLSVSGINQLVYKRFRYSNQTIEHGVAVVIDAAMLYKEIDTPRIYCTTNAATTESRKGGSLDSFRDMFADVVEYSTLMSGKREIDRNAEKRNSFEPTDVQAEILWNKCVPTDYIMFYWDLEEDFFYGD